MTFDNFINECVNYLTREGLLMQPQPIEISGKKYYDELWWFTAKKDSWTKQFTAEYRRYKIVEKNEENKNGVVSFIIDNNWLLTEIAYAQDISNFYDFKYEIKTVYMGVENDDFIAETDNSVNEAKYPANEKYPSKNDSNWYSTSQGVGRMVEHYHRDFNLSKDRETFVSSMPPFRTTYDVYKYLLNGCDDGDFSNQTEWNVYVDPRHSDGNYLDPNIKIAWHNELLDEFLSAGGDGSAYSVKVWGGIPKLRADATGGMEIQTIEIGEYDYSTGNLLTSYSGVYTEASNAHGTDFL